MRCFSSTILLPNNLLGNRLFPQSVKRVIFLTHLDEFSRLSAFFSKFLSSPTHDDRRSDRPRKRPSSPSSDCSLEAQMNPRTGRAVTQGRIWGLLRRDVIHSNGRASSSFCSTKPIHSGEFRSPFRMNLQTGISNPGPRTAHEEPQSTHLAELTTGWPSSIICRIARRRGRCALARRAE